MVKLEKETRVGVIFEGKMKICTVTKYTTCDDVIEMVMYNSAKVDPANEFALFEIAQGVETILTGKASVLKVVRSWGSAKGNVSLLVRKVDGVIKKKIKISKAKQRIEKIRAMLGVQKKDDKLIKTTPENNLNEEIRYEKSVYESYVTVHSDESNCVPKSEKLTLMKRYLEDQSNVFYNSRNDNVMGVSHAHIDGDENDNGEETRTDLDSAFVDEFDETVVDSTDELNNCMSYDHDTSDAESAFYESNCADNEFERNIFKDDVNVMETENIRELFAQCRYKHNMSYDRALVSFMDSIICPDHIDSQS